MLDIPGGQASAGVLQHVYPFESLQPVIQAFLIAELAVLHPCIAPFQAALPPPAEGCHPFGVVAEVHELDTIDATVLRLVIIFCIAVFADEYRLISHFVQQDGRVLVKQHIGVYVGTRGEIELPDAIQDDGGGTGPAIFGGAAGRLYGQQLFIFKLLQGDGGKIG